MVFPIKKYRVYGESMEPALRDGDTVLACHMTYVFLPPKKGQVVVVSHPTKKIPIIKRITQVKNGKYFLEGDNREKSSGSNDFGWLEKAGIEGKVFYKLS